MSWFSKQNEAEQQAKAGAQQSGSPFGLTETEQLQKQIFISTFAMLSKLASSDGTISKKEAVAVDRFMKSVLELDEPRRKFAIAVFNKSRNSPTSFEEYAEHYRTLLRDKPRMYEWMVDVLLRLSFADQVFSHPEEEMIRKACRIFGIAEERYQQLKSRHVPAGENLRYDVLGCSPNSTNEEIQQRYQEMEKEYDPQRVREMGLPEEFIKLAEEKYEALKSTYQEIRKARGF